jgi:hypothetical protein
MQGNLDFLNADGRMADGLKLAYFELGSLELGNLNSNTSKNPFSPWHTGVFGECETKNMLFARRPFFCKKPGVAGGSGVFLLRGRKSILAS